MTARRQTTKEPAKVEETPVEQAPEEDSTSVEQFNEHVKALVGLFFEERVQGLEQRITDLETLLASPPLEYVEPAPKVPNPPQAQRGGEVPWYQPDL